MTWMPASFERFRETVRRGDAAREAGRFRDAVDAYSAALAVRGDDVQLAEELDVRLRAAECFLELGELPAAEAALESLENRDLTEVEPVTRGGLRTVHARLALYRGRAADAAAAAGEAWELLRGTDAHSRVARALAVRGHAHRQLGRIDDARESYLDALAAARRADDRHEAALASANLGSLLWLSGRYHEARTYHRRAVEIHEALDKDVHLARELFALAVDEFHAGEWTEATALLDRCAEVAERVADAWLASTVRIAKARLELVRGQDPRAALADARKHAAANGHDHDLVVIDQLLAECSIVRGEWSRARTTLLDALARARKASAESEPVADLLVRLARAEDALGDPDGRVRDLLETALRIAAAREFRVVEGLALRAQGEFLARRDRGVEAVVALEKSVAVFRELRMPYETGRSLAVLGALRQDAGEMARGETEIREAAAAFRALGASRDAARAEDELARSGGSAVAPAAAPGADPFAELVTVSAAMENAIGRARRIARSDLPVLVLGDTGTGKELFAKAIHRASARAQRPCLAVNCAALSETLLESELFGHEKGAFTGAASRRAGIFEAAAGGTVFLDEIGKAPLSLQAKLLRVLDTGEVRRVGGVEAIHVGVRIVAATNRDLDELVREGTFLPDLVYRLRGFEIRIPALKERPEDVALLFETFAGRPASAAAREILEAHDWPGNVRELRNLAESAAFLASGRGPIPCDALPEWIRRAVTARAAEQASLAESERDAIEEALATAGGNRSRAARALGISRQTLYTKMTKHGIATCNNRSADAA